MCLHSLKCEPSRRRRPQTKSRQRGSPSENSRSQSRSPISTRRPTCWKTSSVVPVPKSSKHNEVANHRPISLLPVVSKLLEQHIHQVITTHLNETRPLSNKQWGFQPGKSTVTALLAVTHDWLNALESRHNVCSVFLDLRKAFNSVPHRLLLEKLNTYALDPCILSWLHSYLAERKQHVVVGGDSYPDSPVLSGVPQGLRFGSTIIPHLY